MNVSLKAMIEGIVKDLIESRYEADLAVAKLAEHYRDDPKLRALSIPSLNISNVEVDFRFVFDDTPAESTKDTALDERSRKQAVDEIVNVMRNSVLDIPTVAKIVGQIPARRQGLEKELTDVLSTTLQDQVSRATPISSKLIEKQVAEVLATRGVESLSEKEVSAIRTIIESAHAKLQTIVPRPQPQQRTQPRIVIGPEALAKVDPAAVSRISFSIDLDAKRWLEVVDEDGESTNVRHVLADE